jgi:hypothetical protein
MPLNKSTAAVSMLAGTGFGLQEETVFTTSRAGNEQEEDTDVGGSHGSLPTASMSLVGNTAETDLLGSSRTPDASTERPLPVRLQRASAASTATPALEKAGS